MMLWGSLETLSFIFTLGMGPRALGCAGARERRTMQNDRLGPGAILRLVSPVVRTTGKHVIMADIL